MLFSYSWHRTANYLISQSICRSRHPPAAYRMNSIDGTMQFASLFANSIKILFSILFEIDCLQSASAWCDVWFDMAHDVVWFAGVIVTVVATDRTKAKLKTLRGEAFKIKIGCDLLVGCSVRASAGAAIFNANKFGEFKQMFDGKRLFALAVA